jgi:TPR repeat protein
LSQEEKAVKLIRSAARLEHAAALYQYAMWLLEDKLPDGTVLREEEKELFLTFMVAAADQGFANAQGMVAKYYADRRDYARAAEYAEPAAAQGNIDGQFLMGTCILIFVSKGDSSKGSLADAMKFWRSAAEQGDAVSAQLLSETLSVGLKGKFEGFEQDYVEAVKFARMAADQGNVLAQRYLGEYYYSGLGVAQDFAEALRFFRLAAEQGDAPAQLKVGEMYQAGEGASVNLEEGARYCRMAMEQGNTSAHLLYAVLTTNNGVMPEDQGEINRLWMRGAEVGHPHFQLSMAKDKVDEDKDFAVKLCRLAIAQNHAPAMTFLAELLRSSDGATGADKDEAKKLLEDAWDKDAEAALALGRHHYPLCTSREAVEV